MTGLQSHLVSESLRRGIDILFCLPYDSLLLFWEHLRLNHWSGLMLSTVDG